MGLCSSRRTDGQVFKLLHLVVYELVIPSCLLIKCAGFVG